MANTRSQLIAAQIYEVDDDGNKKGGGICVDCMFNPFEYSVVKSNTYIEDPKNQSDIPQFTFQKAGAQKLRLDLFFDTYETGEDVSRITEKLWKLMETNTRQPTGPTDKLPPPEVVFEWGVMHFRAIITDVTVKFTLFKVDGTPVRALVNVSFWQNKDKNEYRHQNPTSGGGNIQRVWQVMADDRLDAIAYEVYGDATRWRMIADSNKLRDPLGLRPGQTLIIPTSGE
jgi:nucleoid-associated protein YgaU